MLAEAVAADQGEEVEVEQLRGDIAGGIAILLGAVDRHAGGAPAPEPDPEREPGPEGDARPPERAGRHWNDG